MCACATYTRDTPHVISAIYCRPAGHTRRGMNGTAGENRHLPLDLSKYDISPETGFLPAPLTPLRGQLFSRWEDLVARLPALIESKRLRAEVLSLPETEFSDSTLGPDEQQWRRAYVVISYLGMAYVWMEGQAGVVDTIPRVLAVPWVVLSEHLGLKPIITYTASVLYNYDLRDPSKGIKLDNLKALCRFLPKEDESNFFMAHVCVERAAAPGVKAMADCFQHMLDGNRSEVAKCLEELRKSLKQMTEEMNRLYETCDPVFFFVKLRPFVAGFKNLDPFPHGIVYEGVDHTPRQYYGASGSQSSSVFAYDLFLGTDHAGRKEYKAYIDVMKDYIPRKHGQFLSELDSLQPRVREFCRCSGDPQLVAGYNRAVEALVEFRNDHIVVVTRYVVNQVEHSVNPALDKKGTGGTHFMEFLKRLRDDTAALKITT